MERRNSTILGLCGLFFFTGLVLSDTCDTDWEPYKDESCLKVFDIVGLINYEQAESVCKENNASLISIAFEDKQKFIENFIKSKEIVDYVWIGLKYESGGNYVWSDGTSLTYSNWAPGSPQNNPDYCVQIETDTVQFGKWRDVLCTKKNLVLCEKVQPWSLLQLQNEVMNIKQNLIPIGFIYVQLPKERPPGEIWSWMSWEDVSSDYESVFFRVAGKNSSAFGDVQEQTSPRITSVKEAFQYRSETDEITISANNGYSPFITTAGDPCMSSGCYRGIAFRHSADEVRPRNMAIRIWKRTPYSNP